MPWSEYKVLVTNMLPKDTSNLRTIQSRYSRWNKKTSRWPRRWSLSLHKGRLRVSKRIDTNLSDVCYREPLFAGLSKKEKPELVKGEICGRGRGFRGNESLGAIIYVRNYLWDVRLLKTDSIPGSAVTNWVNTGRDKPQTCPHRTLKG